MLTDGQSGQTHQLFSVSAVNLPLFLLSQLASTALERWNPWPHVPNRHISISQLLSLWRHSHYDVIRYWAGHAQRYGRTNVRMDTLPRLIRKDDGVERQPLAINDFVSSRAGGELSE